jgi:gliding motility-associated-like protein
MRNLLLLLYFVLTSLGVQAQYLFTENKGQWNENVQFKTTIPGGTLYLENNRFLFDRYDTETVSAVFASHSGGDPIATPEKLACHAYEMLFVGSNLAAISGKKQTGSITSYFTSQGTGKGANSFEEVIYDNLYNGIDLKIYSKGNLKYDFVVEPNSDPSVIKIRYEGVNPKIKSDGALEFKTALGRITESAPFAYQIVDGLIQRVECRYVTESNVVSFEIGAYDKSLELIIDPELIFSTYSGSFADNFGYTATFDIEGHLYSGSSVFGTGYPVTTGAYQADWSGGGNPGGAGTDIALTKFSLDGTSLVYSTYLGGSGNELPHSLVTDSLGNLYVLGTTGSSDFPTSENAFLSSFQGGTPQPLGSLGITYPNGTDMIVTVLDPSGQNILGSTYLGGSANDGINTASALRYNYADEIRGEIELDLAGNILVGSSTFSSDYPTTEGAFQESASGGQDGIFSVLSGDASQMLTSTYIGGSGNDAVFSFSFSAQSGVTLGGGTTSDDLPIPAQAYISAYSGGSADGFILTIDEALSGVSSGTYLGTSFYDQVYFIDRDSDENVYAFGQTESTTSDLFFNASYGAAGQGMFITKFPSDLESAEFSTTFGATAGVPAISPTAFAVDLCNRIYLSGWGGATNDNGTTVGLDVTDDAFQSTTDGSDFYFLVLEDDANALSFASFYGGQLSAEHVDGGTSRFDRTGKIYQAVCAGCGSNDDFPIEPANAYSPLNNSNNCNLGVAKIDFDLPLSLADFESSNECLPNPITFENTSDTFSGSLATYEWIFPNGDVINGENVSYLFDAPGDYEVQLVLNDPLACNLTDTITKTVTVFSQLILDIPDTLITCDGSLFEVTATTNGTANSFIWAEDENLESVILEGETDSTLTIEVEAPTTVFLQVDNGLCTDLRSVFLVPEITAEISTSDTLLCNQDELEVGVSSDYPDLIFTWTPAVDILEGQGTSSVLVNTSTSTSINATVANEFGCELALNAMIESFQIELDVVDDTLACFNDPITLEASSEGTAQTFEWSLSPSFDPLLNVAGDSAITVTPGSTTSYFIRVDNNGCTLTDTVHVSLLEAGTTLNTQEFICRGDTAVLFVSNDFPGNNLSHSWEPKELIVSGQNTSTIRAVILEPTTFTVTSSTEFGCTVENSVTIFTSDLSGEDTDATAEPEAIVVGDESQLNAFPSNPDFTYQWQPQEGLSNPFINDPVGSPEVTTWYTVTITDVNDLGFCQKSDSVLVRVFDSFCGSPNIFVPNAFTPNDDGENDILLVRGANITDLTFTVFNRWGEEVFKTEDQSRGWDGTYKGNPAEPAVFVYQLEAVCDDGQTYFEKGNVTLIR